jgi:hypothetical protein
MSCACALTPKPMMTLLPLILLALTALSANLTAAGPACCAWDGVGSSGDDDRVTAMRLPGRGLAGALLATALAGLTCLQELDISCNTLSRDLAPLPTFTPALRAANLSSNLLGGARADLAVLPTLVVLDASDNSHSGTLAPDLCASALALRVLDLSANRLTDRLLFDPSSPSWTSLIAGYAWNDMPKEAIGLLPGMLSARVTPNGFTFANLLKAAAPGSRSTRSR